MYHHGNNHNRASQSKTTISRYFFSLPNINDFQRDQSDKLHQQPPIVSARRTERPVTYLFSVCL